MLFEQPDNFGTIRRPLFKLPAGQCVKIWSEKNNLVLWFGEINK
jgi:hypothetical protein